MVPCRVWLPRPRSLAGTSPRFPTRQKGDGRHVPVRGGHLLHHGVYPSHTGAHGELRPVEDTPVCANAVIPHDVRGCIWSRESMCDESVFHGSGLARGYGFHGLCPDDHLLQHCHDAAGAWQYGLDGCAVDAWQLARAVHLPTAAADVYRR